EAPAVDEDVARKTAGILGILQQHALIGVRDVDVQDSDAVELGRGRTAAAVRVRDTGDDVGDAELAELDPAQRLRPAGKAHAVIEALDLKAAARHVARCDHNARARPVAVAADALQPLIDHDAVRHAVVGQERPADHRALFAYDRDRLVDREAARVSP